MTATKKISPAEKARREAQSAEDRGEIRLVKVDLWGEVIDLDPTLYQELDLLADAMISDDDTETEEERIKASLRIVRRLCGNRWAHVMAALKRANDGHAPLAAMREIMEKCAEAAQSPESSGSRES